MCLELVSPKARYSLVSHSPLKRHLFTRPYGIPSRVLLVMLGHTLQHAFGGRRSPSFCSIHLASLLGSRRRFSGTIRLAAFLADASSAAEGVTSWMHFEKL